MELASLAEWVHDAWLRRLDLDLHSGTVDLEIVREMEPPTACRVEISGLVAFDLQQGLSETLVFDVVQLEATGFVHQDRDALERGLHHLWPLDVGSLDALVLEIHARGLAVFAIQSKVGAEGWFLARQLTVVDQQGVEVARLGV